MRSFQRVEDRDLTARFARKDKAAVAFGARAFQSGQPGAGCDRNAAPEGFMMIFLLLTLLLVSAPGSRG